MMRLSPREAEMSEVVMSEGDSKPARPPLTTTGVRLRTHASMMPTCSE
jgi:hypothetical protein